VVNLLDDHKNAMEVTLATSESLLLLLLFWLNYKFDFLFVS